AAATGLARGLFSTNEKAINLTPTAPAALIALPANTTPTEALIATATLLSPTSVPPVGSDTIYVEYILDASGSMLELLQGKTKLAIAQDVLSERVAALPPDVHVGLRVYGHRVPYQQEEESCKDIELVVPIETGGAAQILTWLPSMQGQGMTPMSESIRLAAEDFTFDPDRNNSIILISDGMETCGDDPSEVAGYLRELGINFTIHVIGLGVDAQTEAQLSRLAEVGQGIYQDANSEQELKSALEEINQVVVQPAPVPTEQPTSPPTFTPLPEPNFDATSEGSVQASSTSSGYPASSAIDGDTTTSWFSRGPNIDGPTSTFQWTGLRDDLITSLTILSNKDHSNPSFRTGYGFDSVMVQILDAAGSIVFEETIELPGTPDPDVILKPGVVGRSVVLIFSGHESVDCGGIGELVVGVTR
ncbi:MAG TPA: VWA domain-containing protein, partial [Anaerolineales bacterium]|nr:VWA domain-containing protein [Anaerolineales bacterium]